MSANMWITLGVIALAFSGFAIPYGFYLRSETPKTTTSTPTDKIPQVENKNISGGKIRIKEALAQKDSMPTPSQSSKSSVEVKVQEVPSQLEINKTAASSATVVSSPQPKEIKDSPGGSFFLNQPLGNLQAVLLKASERHVPAFVVIYDNEHPTLSKLNYSLGYFMDYQTTKRLVDEFFVSAVVPVSQADARKLIPEDDPLENCRLVIIRADGHILLSEGVYANPDEGLKRVRNVISQWKLNGGKNIKSGS